MQRTPAGLPLGMPGIADEIEGAMQHAPQPGRHDGVVSNSLIVIGLLRHDLRPDLHRYHPAPRLRSQTMKSTENE